MRSCSNPHHMAGTGLKRISSNIFLLIHRAKGNAARGSCRITFTIRRLHLDWTKSLSFPKDSDLKPQRALVGASFLPAASIGGLVARWSIFRNRSLCADCAI